MYGANLLMLSKHVSRSKHKLQIASRDGARSIKSFISATVEVLFSGTVLKAVSEDV